MQMNRRIFLIGSAAAIAAATAPVLALSAPAPMSVSVQPVPALLPFRRRLIIDIIALNEGNGPGYFSILAGERCVDQLGLGAGSSYRWRAENGIAVVGDEIVRATFDSVEGAIGSIDMISSYWSGDEKEPINALERYTFPSRGDPAIMPLDVQDAERLARWRATWLAAEAAAPR